VLAPYNREFVGFHMTQDAAIDKTSFIFDLLLNSFNNSRSVADALRFNGYDPMSLHVDGVRPDGAYAANIFYALAKQVDIQDEDLFMWFQLCWSYVGSFLPSALVSKDLRLLSDSQLRDLKMPWPVQYICRQSSLRVGNTYYYTSPQTSPPWDSTFPGANTTTAFSNPYIYGHIGFTSTSVPGPIIIAPGIDITSATGSTASFSWSFIPLIYEYLSLKYPALFVMSQVIPDSMNDCACFADIENTSFNDNVTSTALGTLTPKVIRSLGCSSKLPTGMCKTSAALTIRTHLLSGGIILENAEAFVVSDRAQSALLTVLSIAMAARGTNVQTIQASGGISEYIFKELSGGYEKVFPDKNQLVEMLQTWVVGSPTVQLLNDAAVSELTRNLPSFLPAESIVSFVSDVAYKSLGAVAAALVGKAIGLSRNARRNEL